MSDTRLKLSCPNSEVLVGGQITATDTVNAMTRLECKKEDGVTQTLAAPSQGNLSDPTELTACSTGYDRIDFWKDDNGVTGIQFFCDGSETSSVIGSQSGEVSTLQCPGGERISGIEVSGFFPAAHTGNWMDILGAECTSGKKETFVSTVTSFEDSGWRRFSLLMVVIISAILLIYVVFSFWRRP